ncbi:MAG: hypothetical protein IAG13_30200 [Deltaproteobacteria bacterium]|nr:hypothetical protein [Nannocystaceae bacterium]
MAEHLSADSATAAVQLDVAEAALRDLFEHNASGIQQRAARVCIKLMGKDPGAAFLARFADLGRPVVAGSAFKRMRRSKRAWDLRLYVGEIRLIDATHAEASGGYYEGGLSSSGEHLWLELTGGRWTVVARRFEWIS